MNTAELIVLCRQQLARIEEKSARGVDEVAVMEIAAFAGLATQLRYAAEMEYEERCGDEERRSLMGRERPAEAS